MTEQIDNDVIEDEVEDPAGIYMLAWYAALHFDDFKNGKIVRHTFVDESYWTEIINFAGWDINLPHLPIVWELKTGNLVFNRETLLHGTYDPRDSIHDPNLDNLHSILTRIRGRIEKRQQTAGTLENDPKLALFFNTCGALTCQVKFPDGTIMNVNYPNSGPHTINGKTIDNSGILLYNIVSFGRDKEIPSGQPLLQALKQQAKQQLDAIKASDGNGLEWARVAG